jgi:hypothetical protein
LNVVRHHYGRNLSYDEKASSYRVSGSLSATCELAEPFYIDGKCCPNEVGVEFDVAEAFLLDKPIECYLTEYKQAVGIFTYNPEEHNREGSSGELAVFNLRLPSKLYHELVDLRAELAWLMLGVLVEQDLALPSSCGTDCGRQRRAYFVVSIKYGFTDKWS